MDFGRGISFVRQDPAWLGKVIIGSLLSMLPILNFATIGYAMNVLRNVYTGRETPLPEWGNNFGDYFVRGLLGVVIQIIYSIPLFVLMCGVYGFSFVTIMAASSDGTDSMPIALLLLMPVLFIGGLFCGLLGMVATARFALTNDFGQALRFSEVLAEFRRGLGAWLGMLLTLMLAIFAFSIGFIITCGLAILLSFYLTLTQYHWMAQAYRQSSGSVEPTSYNY